MGESLCPAQLAARQCCDHPIAKAPCSFSSDPFLQLHLLKVHVELSPERVRVSDETRPEGLGPPQPEAKPSTGGVPPHLQEDQVDCSKGQSILSLELLQSGQAVKEEPAQLLPVPPPLPPAFPHHHHLASPQKSVETSIQEAKLSSMKSALR